MPAFPPAPPDGSGEVLITLNTGLQLKAEWIADHWWSHLPDNPEAAPIDASFVVSWQPLE